MMIYIYSSIVKLNIPFNENVSERHDDESFNSAKVRSPDD